MNDDSRWWNRLRAKLRSPLPAIASETPITGIESSSSSTEESPSLPDLIRESPRRAAGYAALIVALVAFAAFRYDDLSHRAVVGVYIAVLVVCAATDLASFRVPNILTYPATAFAVLVGALLPDADLPATLVGGVTAGGFMLLFLIISRGAMGLGDVKLAAFVGFALGWPLIAPALILMSLAGGAAALALLLLRLKSRKDPIPYAPFISGAAIVILLWQGAAFLEL